jgi:hypothetical protein
MIDRVGQLGDADENAMTMRSISRKVGGIMAGWRREKLVRGACENSADEAMKLRGGKGIDVGMRMRFPVEVTVVSVGFRTSWSIIV